MKSFYRRDQRSLLYAGKVMSMISTTMACNETCRFANNYAFVVELWLAHLDSHLRPL